MHLIFYLIDTDAIDIIGVPHEQMDVPAYFGEAESQVSRALMRNHAGSEPGAVSGGANAVSGYYLRTVDNDRRYQILSGRPLQAPPSAKGGSEN